MAPLPMGGCSPAWETLVPRGRRLCAMCKLCLLLRPSPERSVMYVHSLSSQDTGRAWEVRAWVPQRGVHLGSGHPFLPGDGTTLPPQEGSAVCLPDPHLLFCLSLTSPRGRMVNVWEVKESTASVQSAPLWTEPSQACSRWELGKSRPGSSRGPGRWHLFLGAGRSFFIDLFRFEVCITVENRKACISFPGGSGAGGFPGSSPSF